MKYQHIRTVSGQRPSEAVNTNLALILQFFVNTIGSVAVLQRQATWKTPFPQIIFEDDDNNNNA